MTVLYSLGNKHYENWILTSNLIPVHKPLEIPCSDNSLLLILANPKKKKKNTPVHSHLHEQVISEGLCSQKRSSAWGLVSYGYYLKIIISNFECVF